MEIICPIILSVIIKFGEVSFARTLSLTFLEQFQKKGVLKTIRSFKGRVIAASPVVHLEGREPKNHNVIITFPSLEQAQGWYDCADYKAVIPVRTEHAPGADAMLLPGLETGSPISALEPYGKKFVKINGKQHYWWRAVDQDGEVVDVYLQAKRDGATAKRFFRRLLRNHGREPRKIVTDKLRSYGVAHRELIPDTIHSTEQYENNRAEQSHEPTRVRERGRRRFKSVRQPQRFLSVHAAVSNLFNLGRHLIKAEHYRSLRVGSFADFSRAVALELRRDFSHLKKLSCQYQGARDVWCGIPTVQIDKPGSEISGYSCCSFQPIQSR